MTGRLWPRAGELVKSVTNYSMNIFPTCSFDRLSRLALPKCTFEALRDVESTCFAKIDRGDAMVIASDARSLAFRYFSRSFSMMGLGPNRGTPPNLPPRGLPNLSTLGLYPPVMPQGGISRQPGLDGRECVRSVCTWAELSISIKEPFGLPAIVERDATEPAFRAHAKDGGSQPPLQTDRNASPQELDVIVQLAAASVFLLLREALG